MNISLKEKVHSFYSDNKWLFIFVLSFPHIFHLTIPDGAFSYLELIVNRLSLISFALLTFFFIKRKKISKLFVVLLFNDLFLLFVTIINNITNINKTILFISSSLSLAMIVELFFDVFKDLINGLLLNFEIQIYPNLLIMLLFGWRPSYSIGYDRNDLFLGVKNNLILYFLPALFLCVIYYLKIKKSKRVIILTIAIIVSVVLSQCVTMIAAFFLGTCAFVYFCFIRKNKSKFAIWIVVIPLIMFFIIVMPYLLFGKNIIVDYIMNKVYCVTSFLIRTQIWTDASKYIAARPIFGYGFHNASTIVLHDKYYGITYNCDGHNDIIFRLFNYGFFGLAIYLYFNYTLLKSIKKCNNDIYKTLFICFVFTIYIALIPEKYNRFFEFNIVFFLIYKLAEKSILENKE